MKVGFQNVCLFPSGDGGQHFHCPFPALDIWLDVLIADYSLCLFVAAIGEEEFDTLEKLNQKLQTALTMDVVEDVDTGAVVGFIMFYPTKLSRSFSPLYLCEDQTMHFYTIFTSSDSG